MYDFIINEQEVKLVHLWRQNILVVEVKLVHHWR